MNLNQFRLIESRREFLRNTAGGIGMLALGELLTRDGLTAASTNPLSPKKPHFAPKAKNVIFMFMEGGPSQYELFDPKPDLVKFDGHPLPPSRTKDLKLAFIKPTASVMASHYPFQPYGGAGVEYSNLIPHIASRADDICLVRSMHTDAFNHHPGQLLMFTGHTLAGRPSAGSWVVYGLGSESANLPGFVVLTSGQGTSGGASNFSSGFLPSHYQGTVFRNTGDPILYLSNPDGISKTTQRETLNVLRDLNDQRQSATGDTEIASRMASYELAFRMQMEAPQLVDLSGESQKTLEMYGANSEDQETRQFAINCLLARRLVERGVRFVLMTDASWDDHIELNRKLPPRCRKVDQATAALIADLKQRGLLEETLIIWGGEFGRTPMVEIRNPEDAGNAGRDHHPNAFSMWLAGGGIKGGQAIGATDDLGLEIVQDPIHVNDLQATMLHCLGFDHTRLTYRYMGRDFRLTDVHGNVIQGMLA